MTAAQLLVAAAGYASLVIAAGYSLVTLAGVLAWSRFASGPRALGPPQAPVTVLKPLCGAEPGLYAHLRSFCEQRYPQFQVIFGSLDVNDPALAVAAQLVREFPDLPIEIVANPQRHGHNNKSSNLINMLARARHPVLLIADSDIAVDPDYLATVTAALHDERIGLVTCLSQDVPTPSLWSRLGAMYINEWYFPSVMFAWMFGYESYASGQTLCLRGATLEAVGGLGAIADHLADDYQLGQLVRGLGLRTVLSPYEVHAAHHEPDFASLISHELRWMRTLHIVSPWSFRMIWLTFSLLLGAAGLVLTAAAPWRRLAWVLFGLTVLARFGLHATQRLRGRRTLLQDIALVPLRDVLTFVLWCQSFFSRRVTWRGNQFQVDAAGVMRRIA